MWFATFNIQLNIFLNEHERPCCSKELLINHIFYRLQWSLNMGQCFSKPSEKKAPPPATEVNGPGVVSPQDINVGINSPVRPLPPPPAKSGIAANWSFIDTVYYNIVFFPSMLLVDCCHMTGL